MKCSICKHGDTNPGLVTVTFDLPDGGAIVFQGVPAQICENCGEKYFDERTTSELLRQCKRPTVARPNVEIRPYAAA